MTDKQLALLLALYARTIEHIIDNIENSLPVKKYPDLWISGKGYNKELQCTATFDLRELLTCIQEDSNGLL